MKSNHMYYPQFYSGERVLSIVSYSPEIEQGTEATIISPQLGALYAVQMPNGELYRWFAGFELQSANGKSHCSFNVGDSATVISEQGHSPMVKQGTKVKIIKVIPKTYFYDLQLKDGKYHRWLAEFELTYLISKY